MPHTGCSPKRPTLEATMPQKAMQAHTDTAGNNAVDHEHPPTLLARIAMGENLEGTMRGCQIERNVSTNQRCLGTRERSLQEVAAMTGTKWRHMDSLMSSAKTTISQESESNLQEWHREDSLMSSGITSSEENLLISMLYSAPCTTLHLLKRTLDMWDKLKYLLAKLNLRGRSKSVENGPQPGTRPPK